MIYIYLLSNLFFFACLKNKKISFKNIFIYVYWGLMLLYPMAVYSAFTFDIEVFASSMHGLVGNEYIIDEVLLTASLALCTFSLCLIIKPIKKENTSLILCYNIRGYKYLYFFLFPFVLYLNSITNWTTDGVGFLPSLAAYSRNLMTVLAIILIIPNNGKMSHKLLYVFMFMVITFASTQRTNALIVIIALVYTLKSSKTAIRISFLGLASLLALGAIRNDISALNFLYPILGEGLFGAWGLLQAIDVSSECSYSLSNLFMLFNESLNWLFNMLHIPLDLPVLSDIVEDSGQIYYPMGGFFYLSDAYLMHPYLGPIFYTILIYCIYRKSVNHYYRYHTPFSLICLSLLFDAVKGSLCVFIAMLLFHYICYRIVVIKRKKCNYLLVKSN